LKINKLLVQVMWSVISVKT